VTVATVAGHPWIEVDGLPNARELGGIPLAGGGRVRHAALYRSGTPHAVTARGLDTAVGELRIATVLDLRAASEAERIGAGPFASDPRVTRYVLELGGDPAEAPFAEFDAGDDLMGAIYLAILDASADALRRTLEAIAAAASAPLLFHCHAGQDRTGVVAATLLGLLGASEDDIVADYLLTQTWLLTRPPEVRQARQEAIARLGVRDGSLDPAERSIRRWLAAVRERWGSAEAMALAVGVPSATIATLRRELVDPA